MTITLTPAEQQFVCAYRDRIAQAATHPAVLQWQTDQETVRNFLTVLVRDAGHPPEVIFTLSEDCSELRSQEAAPAAPDVHANGGTGALLAMI